MNAEQNKIYGASVAKGYLRWENGGYVFLNRQRSGSGNVAGAEPKIVVNEAYLNERGVSMDDMLDCIDQLEEYGTPKEVRDMLGYEPMGGYQSPGMTVKSRINPMVSCNVVSHSGENDQNYDMYVEWFYDEDNVGRNGPSEAFINEYWRLSGVDRPVVSESKREAVMVTPDHGGDHFADGKLPRKLAALLRRDGAIAVNQVEIRDNQDSTVTLLFRRGNTVGPMTIVRLFKLVKQGIITLGAEQNHLTMKLTKEAFKQFG